MARARAAVGLTQEQVLAQLEERGFEERQNWLSRIENGTTKRVDFDKLVALAQVLCEDPYYLFAGERRDRDETPFLAQLRALERDLDPRGSFTVLRLAQHQAEQARAERERLRRAAEAGIYDAERAAAVINDLRQRFGDEVAQAAEAGLRRALETLPGPAAGPRRGSAPSAPEEDRVRPA